MYTIPSPLLIYFSSISLLIAWRSSRKYSRYLDPCHTGSWETWMELLAPYFSSLQPWQLLPSWEWISGWKLVSLSLLFSLSLCLCLYLSLSSLSLYNFVIKIKWIFEKKFKLPVTNADENTKQLKNSYEVTKGLSDPTIPFLIIYPG